MRRAFRSPRVEREVDEEIAFHLAMRAEQLRARGLSDDAARREALRQFGPTTPVRDSCITLDRERVTAMNRVSLFENLWQGVVFALRSLRHHTGFAAAVALTMALGVGANVAVFSVAEGVLLRPLPYRGGEAQLVDAARLSLDVFGVLGSAAFLGRTLLPADAEPGAPRVAVLAHELWTTRFGGDRAVVGSTIVLDGDQITVVGVMPPRYTIPGSTSLVWRPLSLAGASADHGERYLRVLARLRPGATVDDARRELRAAAAQLATDFTATNRGWTVSVVSLPTWIVGAEWRRAVLVLSGVVACVLLIACANAANLQLARGAARRKEIALRAALGADRARRSSSGRSRCRSCCSSARGCSGAASSA